MMGLFKDGSYAPLAAPQRVDVTDREATSMSSASSSAASTVSIMSWTPDGFKKAVVDGNAEQVRQMIRAKADVDQTYQDGLTPMHFAAIHNRPEVARVLKYAGANVLAETKDENRLTAASIAHMSGNNEVFEIICEELPDAPSDANVPLWRRLTPPCLVVILVALDTALSLFLLAPETRWDGFQEGPETARWYTALALSLLAATFCLLSLTHFLDPGTVEREDVNFVQQLRELPSDQLMILGDDSFAVLKDGKADPVHTYRWCRTCDMWRPPSVSHCGQCRRCFWRFDHHCAAVGNCVALRNHRFFALALLVGVSAWVMGDAAVLHRLMAHGALASLDTWWPPRPGMENVYLAFAYLIYGLLILSVLAPFALFHAGSLLGNYTTKSMWRPSTNSERGRLNTPTELRDIFCYPLRFHGRTAILGGGSGGSASELAMTDQLSDLS